MQEAVNGEWVGVWADLQQDGQEIFPREDSSAMGYYLV